MLCALTDFLDGYCARRYGRETLWGKVLDPLADKFFLCALLMALSAVGRVSIFWSLALLLREFIVMGLREGALLQGISVSVASHGKIKTTIQMITLIVVIANPWYNEGGWWALSELFLKVVTFLITMYSGCCYVYAYYKRVSQ